MLATYKKTASDFRWEEQHLYGSSRVGILLPNIIWNGTNDPTDIPYFCDKARLFDGWKRYEITNHLGNVLSVVTDRKQPEQPNHDPVTNPDRIAEYYEAVVVSARDYYPFGMEMPGRSFSSGPSYRYGFNGKEKDADGEWGDHVAYDYGFRIYNPAVGRFLSVDPLMRSYPMLTPYQFASNRPIDGDDLVQ